MITQRVFDWDTLASDSNPPLSHQPSEDRLDSVRLQSHFFYKWVTEVWAAASTPNSVIMRDSVDLDRVDWYNRCQAPRTKWITSKND